MSVVSSNSASKDAEININSLFQQLSQVRLADKFRLKKRLQGLNKIKDANKKQNSLNKIAKLITHSIEVKALKSALKPKIIYPESLPVSQKVAQIAKAIEES